jgi:hypothetical protein
MDIFTIELLFRQMIKIVGKPVMMVAGKVWYSRKNSKQGVGDVL